MATGSDTKSNLGPDWKKLSSLYAEGAADVEIARELGITLAAFLKMEQESPQFAAFVEKGRTLSQAWWVEMARKNLMNRDFNTSLFKLNMANRFGWADKVDTAKPDDEPVNRDKVQAEIARLAQKMGKNNPQLMRIMLAASEATSDDTEH